MSEINAGNAGTFSGFKESFKAEFPAFFSSSKASTGEGNQNCVVLATKADIAPAFGKCVGVFIEVLTVMQVMGNTEAEYGFEFARDANNEFFGCERYEPVIIMQDLGFANPAVILIKGFCTDGEIKPIDESGISAVTTTFENFFYFSIFEDQLYRLTWYANGFFPPVSWGGAKRPAPRPRFAAGGCSCAFPLLPAT